MTAEWPITYDQVSEIPDWPRAVSISSEAAKILAPFILNLTSVSAQHGAEDRLREEFKKVSEKIPEEKERFSLKTSTHDVALLGVVVYWSQDKSVINNRDELLCAVLDLNEALLRSGGEQPRGMREFFEAFLLSEAILKRAVE